MIQHCFNRHQLTVVLSHKVVIVHMISHCQKVARTWTKTHLSSTDTYCTTTNSPTTKRSRNFRPVDSLGNRKPSQLLSQMMELCPYSKQQSKFLTFLFLDCIPSWLRICKERTTTRLWEHWQWKAKNLRPCTHLQHSTMGAVDSSGMGFTWRFPRWKMWNCSLPRSGRFQEPVWREIV